jgi:uncharacterized protein (AIM24 family)
MPDPFPSPSPDQGLFLKHFSAGKELYDSGRLEEAQRQLEEAYLLRPRDQKVLNLLGLAYFKQEKYDKAEEVYRKLAAESPDAHILYYNLGLIYYKLGRLEDSELAFLKALELSKDNLKIHFYLGSIYERMNRYQDAIFQYRQAGANVAVRRIEDRAPAERPAAPPRRSDDDTARFHGDAVRDALTRRTKPQQRGETEPFLVPGKTLGPVSDVLLADSTAKPPGSEPAPRRRSADDTRPPTDDTRPPQTLPFRGATRSEDIVAFLAGLPSGRSERTGSSGAFRPASVSAPTTPPTRPAVPAPPASETFRLLQQNLLEANFSHKLFVRQGSIYSYSGNLTFWVKEKRPEGQAALVIVSGAGKVMVIDKERDITLMPVDHETVYVQPSNLLACEETLTPRYVRLGSSGGAPEFLALDGRGTIAVAVAGRPLSVNVTRELPVSVAAPSIILWSGSLTATLVEDDKLSEILGTSAQRPALIRLEGLGRVLMSQTL